MAASTTDAVRTRPSRDAVTALSVFAVLLVVVPSRLIFGPLGGAGTPALVVGIALALWWTANRLANLHDRKLGSQPVRRAVLVLAAAIMTSYVVATRRPISPPELRSADMGLLTLCGWLGIVLVLSDALGSLARLEVLLRRVTVLGGGLAGLGILQFSTGRSYLNYFQVPGLVQNSAMTVITDRSGFNRPAGTALHPIEFGVVLTMVLPFALHFALMDAHRSMLRRWWPVAAIAVALPIAISRSAIIGSVVGLAVLVPVWSTGVRRRAYAVLVLLGVGLFVTVPGLLGTLTGLFTGIGHDSSAQSRTGSYALAGTFIGRAPLFGRGFLTFLPSYRILDNQYLGVIIDIGFVGLAALLGVFLTGMRVATRVRRTAADERTRHLAQATVASLATVSVGYAFFDAFSFPMAAAMTFFMVGVAGAIDNLARAEAAAASRVAAGAPVRRAATPRKRAPSTTM